MENKRKNSRVRVRICFYFYENTTFLSAHTMKTDEML
jgi:hypothetical protein